MSKQLFIASSKEGLTYANALKDRLNEEFEFQQFDVKCLLWTDYGASRGGCSTLETLQDLSDSVSYAVAMITPDDTANIRGVSCCIPRDNVVFEFGLFLGKLSRLKVFAVIPNAGIPSVPDLRIPSDLFGITNARYEYKLDADIVWAKDTLREAVTMIIRWIAKFERPTLARRPKSSSSDEFDNNMISFRTYPM